MPPTGSTFVDWQQVDNERRLLMNEDFSWSEPPARARRPITETIRGAAEEGASAGGRVSVAEHWDQPTQEHRMLDEPRDDWDQPTQAHSHFDDLMQEWNEAYGSPRESARDAHSRVFDLTEPGAGATAQSGRRTVVITGRGDGRYVPSSSRRRRPSGLRFHERAGFSPDRTGLWAVFLGIAVLIGCVVH